GRRQFEFILEHGDLAGPKLEEIRGLLNRATRIVHEDQRAQQDHPLMVERAFRGLALKAAAPRCETMTPRDFLDGHEADIVPVMRVFWARNCQARKKAAERAFPKPI